MDGRVQEPKEQRLRRELRSRAVRLRTAVDGTLLAVDGFAPVAERLCASGPEACERLRARAGADVAAIRAATREIGRARLGLVREWRAAGARVPVLAAEYAWNPAAAERDGRLVDRTARRVNAEARALLDGPEPARLRAGRALADDVASLHAQLKRLEEVIP